MPYSNPEQQKLAQKEWYEKNKSLTAQRAKEARKRTKEWYNNIMEQQSCQRCGENDRVVLEWHHIDPTKKDMGVAYMLSRRGKKTILEEIEKCICLCANCHRRLHHEMRNEE